MVLQEDEENMNGNNIQEVMEEVEETAEETSTSGPENMNEKEEVDDIDVEFNTDATTMEVDLAVRRNDVLKSIYLSIYLAPFLPLCDGHTKAQFF